MILIKTIFGIILLSFAVGLLVKFLINNQQLTKNEQVLVLINLLSYIGFTLFTFPPISLIVGDI